MAQLSLVIFTSFLAGSLVNYWTTSRPELDVLLKKLHDAELDVEDISTGVLKLPYYGDDLHAQLGNMDARLDKTEDKAQKITKDLKMCFLETEAIKNETKSIKRNTEKLSRNLKSKDSMNDESDEGLLKWLKDTFLRKDSELTAPILAVLAFGELVMGLSLICCICPKLRKRGSDNPAVQSDSTSVLKRGTKIPKVVTHSASGVNSLPSAGKDFSDSAVVGEGITVVVKDDMNPNVLADGMKKAASPIHDVKASTPVVKDAKVPTSAAKDNKSLTSAIDGTKTVKSVIKDSKPVAALQKDQKASQVVTDVVKATNPTVQDVKAPKMVENSKEANSSLGKDASSTTVDKALKASSPGATDAKSPSVLVSDRKVPISSAGDAGNVTSDVKDINPKALTSGGAADSLKSGAKCANAATSSVKDGKASPVGVNEVKTVVTPSAEAIKMSVSATERPKDLSLVSNDRNTSKSNAHDKDAGSPVTVTKASTPVVMDTKFSTRAVDEMADRGTDYDNPKPLSPKNPESPVDDSKKRKLRRTVCVLSFSQEKRIQHRTQVDRILQQSLTLQGVHVDLCLITTGDDIKKLIPASKVIFIFIELDDRSVIPDDPLSSVADLQWNTVEAVKKQGSDPVVIYVQNRNHRLPKDTLYSPVLTPSIQQRPSLTELNKNGRVLSIDSAFTDFQIRHLSQALKSIGLS